MKLFRKGILMALSAALLLSLACFAAACGGDGETKTVGYSVEIYLEKDGGYALDADKGTTGSGEEGKKLTLSAPAIDGYVFCEGHEGNVTTLTLSANESENVYKFYYDIEVLDILRYDANVASGAARGTTKSTAAENGKAVAAENGFTLQGFRFAGWSYTAGGAAEVQPGTEVEVSGTVTLYAVWDRGYIDRFGGTDLVFLPSSEEEGTLIMQRGEAEFKTTVENELFSFERPDGKKIEGKLFSDYTFAYAQEDLAGTYIFHSSYYNKDDENGEVAPDPTTTLTLDAYGNATYRHPNAIDQFTEEEKGYISYFSFGDDPQYLFLIDSGMNEGSGFIFRFDSVGTQKCFTTTNGEGGTYTLAVTPDGTVYYGSTNAFGLYLDGYGGLTLTHADYTGEWTGRYWIEGTYTLTESLSIYKLHLLVETDARNYLDRLHPDDVVDGFLSLTCYTMPLSEDEFVYVEPAAEHGTFSNGADGSTLVLDGFRNFADSATYTVGNTTHYGSYQAIWSHTNYLTVVMHENTLDGTYTGRDHTFKIDVRQYIDQGVAAFDILGSFSILGEEEFASYRHLGLNDFEDEVIRISETRYEGVSGAYVAEYGVVSPLGGYTKLADGYVTGNTRNCADLYTFTRTGAAADVPKSMVFQLGSTADSNYFLNDVYFVYSAEYDDAAKNVQYYSEITDAEGSDALIWYVETPIRGMLLGTIYFDAAGEAYVGTFLTDEDYFGSIGILTTVEANGNLTERIFELELGSDGKPATFAEIPEMGYELFTIDATGTLDTILHLVARGDVAMYSETGDFEGDVDLGTIRYVGENETGESIMAFFNENGIELFRFVTDTIVYSAPGYLPEEISVYYEYDSSFAKTYTSETGSLKLDGFRSAEYTDAAGDVHRGTYTFSADRKIVYVAAGGTSYAFDISKGFSLTDGIYGTYAMQAGGEWWNVTFDGHSNATAQLGMTKVQGIYRAEENGEVVLFINLETGVNSYRLKLGSIEGHGEAFVYDENLAGAFVGDDWTVLYLDGYRNGTYYFPEGNGWIGVRYELLDEEIGYINIITENFTAQNIILNAEDKTMSYPEYADKDYVYYGEDLCALIVSQNGEISMNYTSGYYIFADGVYRAYLMNNNAEYEAFDLGSAPVDGVWTVGGKKYYPWTAGQSVTFTGTFEVDYESTHENKTASLTFPLTGDVIVSAKGTFTVGNESYSVDVISSFYDETGRHGLALVDMSQYEYSALTEYKYNGNGTGTMKISVVPKEMVMVDGFEREEGITSTLTEHRVGFGPVSITERKLSGDIYIGGNNRLTFTDRDIETTYYYGVDEGPRYNIIFDVNGTTYSMQYNKEDSDYRLYLIGTYQKIEANGYTVGVVKYVYSNGSYEFDFTAGEICDLILYRGTGENAETVVSMSRGLVAAQDGSFKGWALDIGSYDPVTETGKEGKVYVMEVSQNGTSAAVKEYTFMQATDEENEEYVNLCLDENGNVADIVSVIGPGGLFNVESFERGTVSETEERYIIHLTDGSTHTVALLLENGQHSTNTDGTWKFTEVD